MEQNSDLSKAVENQALDSSNQPFDSKGEREIKSLEMRDYVGTNAAGTKPSTSIDVKAETK